MADKPANPSDASASDTIPPSKANNSSSKGRGGKGARSRRNEARRANTNVTAQREITSSEEQKLTAKSSTITWKPSYGCYTGGVSVGCVGFLYDVRSMLRRLKSIAQRPLALLLIDANVNIYSKVSLYLLYVRLCCAQDDGQSAIPGLTLRGVLSEIEKRTAVGMSRTVPKALAFAFNTFGYFKCDDEVIIPIIPDISHELESLTCASFEFIKQFVTSHGADPVPLEYVAEATRLSQILPEFTLTAQFRFTARSLNFWVDITTGDWEVFREINSAARAQGLCNDDFDISSATGQTAQIVRFKDLSDPVSIQQFYSIKNIEETEFVRGLAVRPGDDNADPDDSQNRFRLSFERALVRGFDIPAAAIEAVLSSLATRQSPV